MCDIVAKMKILLLELLSSDHKKTAAHLVEELRVEYHLFVKEIMAYHAVKYGLSGCGTHMSPLTVVQQALAELHQEGLTDKSLSQGIILWSKKPGS
jgi:hypothetical protein